MNAEIKRIIDSYGTPKYKLQELEKIEQNIELAKEIVKGNMDYCPYCQDYYRKGSFAFEKETIETQICIYQDIINSGGNEYADGYADIVYTICPKNHRWESSRTTREKR